jgi:hypothetical protein
LRPTLEYTPVLLGPVYARPMARFSHSAAILTLVGSPPLASLATDELRRS